jgi:Sarcosine oxidase, gamma subunit family
MGAADHARLLTHALFRPRLAWNAVTGQKHWRPAWRDAAPREAYDVVIVGRGGRARDVLAKGVPIDLHRRVFWAGETAATTVAHIGVQLWQVDEAPTYDLIVPRSLAATFWEWLTESIAEFGYAIADQIS